MTSSSSRKNRDTREQQRHRIWPSGLVLVGFLFLHDLCGTGVGVAMSGVQAFAFVATSIHCDGHMVPVIRTSGSNSARKTWSPSSYSSSSSSYSSSSSCLAMGTTSPRIDVSVPSQARCEELGVREWPQQSKKGSWNEKVAPENSLVRYVLEGSGSLAVLVEDETATATATAVITKQPQQQPQQQVSIKPGTLVEIEAGTEAIALQWECDDSKCSEVILLTPGFEEGNVFLGVIAGILLLFGVLLSGVLG